MSDNSLKRNFTKFAGLTIESLEFLININLPVDVKKSREVWTEIFYRYFQEGRLFDIYRLILKVNKEEKFAYFTKAIELELVNEKSDIPLEHTENFMRNLLDFIEFVDTKIITKENLKFEWQLHGLSGIKDMLEKVKQAKIKDNVLRQKINLFIDKINNARKDTLALIEEQNCEQIPEVSEETSLIKTEKELILSQETTALMCQELKHLTIPLSKTKKEDLLNMMKNLHLYYPEDKKKIIQRALKKYYFEAKKIQPFDCLIEVLESKMENIDVGHLMREAFCGIHDVGCVIHKKISQEQIDYFVPGGNINTLIDYVKSWLSDVDNIDEHALQSFTLNLYREHDGIRYKAMLLSILKDLNFMFEKYRGKPLSEILDIKIKITRPELNFDNSHWHPPVFFNKEKDQWEYVATSKYDHDEYTQDISILEYYDLMFNVFNHTLFEYLGHYIYDATQINTEFKDSLKLIKTFISFRITLTIDEKSVNHPLVRGITSRYNDKGIKPAITNLLKHKLAQNKLSLEEIKLLYKDHYDFFKTFGYEFHGYGDFRSHSDYLRRYFEDALDLFDFSKIEDLKDFFKLEFTGSSFYGYESNKRKGELSKEQGNALVRKLKKECIHEVSLIQDYFEIEEEEYVEFVFYDEYKDLDNVQKLLLLRNGIELGKEQTFRGYRESEGKQIYSTEDLKNKYIIDYFCQRFKENSQRFK